MARGWESKSVEAQQDARESPRTAGPPVTPEQAARAQAVQALRLSLAQAEHALAGASHPARRQALEAAITTMRQQIVESGLD